MNSNVPNVPQKPYFELEFSEFIKIIGNEQLKNWSLIAQVLGVSGKTISRWKKHPTAQKAIIDAIHETIENMEKAGKNDWRMYREKLKMFGIVEENTPQNDILDTEFLGGITSNIGG